MPYASQMLATIPWWQVALRREARSEAERLADREHELLLTAFAAREREYAAELDRLQQEQAAEQRLLDSAHRRLEDGEPAAVSVAVASALKAAPVKASVVALRDDAVAIAVVVPGAELAVPAREPSVTAGGKPSTRKLNQGERNDLHCELVCSAAMTAARTALQAAGTLARANVVAVLSEGGSQMPVAYCSVGRDEWRRWGSADVVEAFYDADGWIEQSGRARAVQPLDLADAAEVDEVLRGFAESRRAA
jgi:hypothetical protein